MGLIAARLNEDAKRMRHLALTDDLTGLHNLRSFEARLTEMIRESRYDHTPISLLVLDVDRLKSLNDIYGHLCGAEAVRTVGLIIAENVPRDAVACRYGGDEFAIALPRCLSSQARCFAERIRVAVDARPAILSGHDLPAGTLSVSIGYATNVAGPGNCTQGVDRQWGEELFRSSDRALYAAKTNGRNLVSAPPPAPPTCNIRICRFDPAAGRAIIPSRG
jgi:diguanylate cyclase (GGDEF)-like protein